MSRICEITGKGSMTGHKVSHSQVKTKRKFKINLQKKNLINPATGEKMSVRLSNSALRTLKKWQREGKKYDLRQLIQK
ncbi:MAG: 50S ribosomal protein L28 [Candidatus Moraniibacteriota bacterium]|nr:MAG: 50S ribosomal protein L28 [Candidatus Moranbacteria bacterium]